MKQCSVTLRIILAETLNEESENTNYLLSILP